MQAARIGPGGLQVHVVALDDHHLYALVRQPVGRARTRDAAADHQRIHGFDRQHLGLARPRHVRRHEIDVTGPFGLLDRERADRHRLGRRPGREKVELARLARADAGNERRAIAALATPHPGARRALQRNRCVVTGFHRTAHHAGIHLLAAAHDCVESIARPAVAPPRTGATRPSGSAGHAPGSGRRHGSEGASEIAAMVAAAIAPPPSPPGTAEPCAVADRENLRHAGAPSASVTLHRSVAARHEWCRHPASGRARSTTRSRSPAPRCRRRSRGPRPRPAHAMVAEQPGHAPAPAKQRLQPRDEPGTAGEQVRRRHRPAGIPAGSSGGTRRRFEHRHDVGAAIEQLGRGLQAQGPLPAMTMRSPRATR